MESVYPREFISEIFFRNCDKPLAISSRPLQSPTFSFARPLISPFFLYALVQLQCLVAYFDVASESGQTAVHPSLIF